MFTETQPPTGAKVTALDSRGVCLHGSQVTLDWQGLASGTMRDGVVARLDSRLVAGADTAVIICVGELDAVVLCAGLKFINFYHSSISIP